MFLPVLSLACKYFIFLPISELALITELDDSLLTKSAKNIRKTKRTYS